MTTDPRVHTTFCFFRVATLQKDKSDCEQELSKVLYLYSIRHLSSSTAHAYFDGMETLDTGYGNSEGILAHVSQGFVV